MSKASSKSCSGMHEPPSNHDGELRVVASKKPSLSKTTTDVLSLLLFGAVKYMKQAGGMSVQCITDKYST